MRILIVAYYFPPFNAIGSVRVGRTAEHLLDFGHDVRVISAADQVLEATLESRFPTDRTHYTPWIDVNRPVALALGGRRRTARHGYAVAGVGSGLFRRLGGAYKYLFNFPDGQVGWLPYATREGMRLMREWRPDVVFASAFPVTSLLVARRLARHFGVPWVAELRDLWIDSPFYEHGGVRRRVETRMERRVLGSAAGLVTVSEPLAQRLGRAYDKPIAVVLNGFDRDVYPESAGPPAGGPLRIVYCGMIYAGKRDPTPLFRAIRLLGDDADQVQVSFYGRYMAGMRQLARDEGVEGQVEVHDPVPHRESLRLQQEADALLLLIWEDPRVASDFTGKFFEYMGARRPILALGPSENVACRAILNRGAGVVHLRPEAIAEQLREWIRQKRRLGTLPAPPPEAAAGFERGGQSRRLEAFLQSVASGAAT